MYIINCGGEDGWDVVFGEVDEMPQEDELVTIRNARRILYWEGELIRLAIFGPTGNTRFDNAVPQIVDYCRQAIGVSAAALEMIEYWVSTIDN